MKRRSVAMAVAFSALALNLMSAPSVSIMQTNHLGWPDSFVLRNGEVEAVVVPAIGRVMQFRFIGEEGVFWENPALLGRTVPTNPDAWRTNEWVNFGGDKAWPAPEASWSNWTKRATWRPPPAFDGYAYAATISGDSLIITSPDDPFLGVRVIRRIELFESSGLRITTEFEKRQGGAPKTAIWVVTQLKNPVRLFAPVSKPSIFTRGYILLSPHPPPSLKVDGEFVSLERNPKGSHKIGLDAEKLLWVGPRHTLLIENRRQKGELYPDRGSSTEIYTSPDPLPYIELECLGPIRELKVPGRLSETQTYRLTRRRHPSAEEEARAVLRP